jgi:alanine dehydrogenase
MKIGLIREGKTPPDSRTPLTPQQCAFIVENYPIEIAVQPSPGRCYADQEYFEAGIDLQESLEDCDVIMGVKEVPVGLLIYRKTYFFFSHTIKEQAYNRKLLQAVLAKKIQLIDYEVLTNENGERLIAFGRFAGMVGAHNAMYVYGERSGSFHLKRMKDCIDYAEAQALYQTIHFPPIKIVLTGAGRVGNGAAEVLHDIGIREVSPTDFLEKTYSEAVFTQLHSRDYVGHNNDHPLEKRHFHSHPEQYHSIFTPYSKTADVFINGIYWDSRSPAFFTREEMMEPDFQIQVIADVTCDIAPISSIPSTLRASTIADPIFGYHPQTGEEISPLLPQGIDMMTIDNLPNEMPRDASRAFGEMFILKVLPEFFKPQSSILERATIAKEGQLAKHFTYLQNYADGKERELATT